MIWWNILSKNGRSCTTYGALSPILKLLAKAGARIEVDLSELSLLRSRHWLDMVAMCVSQIDCDFRKII